MAREGGSRRGGKHLRVEQKDLVVNIRSLWMWSLEGTVQD